MSKTTYSNHCHNLLKHRFNFYKAEMTVFKIIYASTNHVPLIFHYNQTCHFHIFYENINEHFFLTVFYKENSVSFYQPDRQRKYISETNRNLHRESSWTRNRRLTNQIGVCKTFDWVIAHFEIRFVLSSYFSSFLKSFYAAYKEIISSTGLSSAVNNLFRYQSGKLASYNVMPLMIYWFDSVFLLLCDYDLSFLFDLYY